MSPSATKSPSLRSSSLKIHARSSTYINNDEALGLVRAKRQGGGGEPRGEGGEPRGEGGKPRGEGGKPRGEGGKPRGEGGKPLGEGGKPLGVAERSSSSEGKAPKDNNSIRVPRNLEDIFGDQSTSAASVAHHIRDGSSSMDTRYSSCSGFYVCGHHSPAGGVEECSCCGGSSPVTNSTPRSSSASRSSASRRWLESSSVRVGGRTSINSAPMEMIARKWSSSISSMEKKRSPGLPRHHKPKKNLRYRLVTEAVEEPDELDLGPPVIFSPWKKNGASGGSPYEGTDDLALILHLGGYGEDLDDELCYFLMRATEEKIHQRTVVNSRAAIELTTAMTDDDANPTRCHIMKPCFGNRSNSQCTVAQIMKPHGVAILGPELWQVLLEGIQVWAFLGLSATAISRMEPHLFFLDQQSGQLKLSKLGTDLILRGVGRNFPLETLIEIDRGPLIHHTILQDQSLKKSDFKHVVALWTNNAQDPLICLSSKADQLNDLIAVIRFLQFYHGMCPAKVFERPIPKHQ